MPQNPKVVTEQKSLRIKNLSGQSPKVVNDKKEVREDELRKLNGMLEALVNILSKPNAHRGSKCVQSGSISKYPDKDDECVTYENETIWLSSTPGTSPLKDITRNSQKANSPQSSPVIDLDAEENELPDKNKFLTDDDATVVQSNPEINVQNSYDEDEIRLYENTSVRENTTGQYLVPPSYPNQVVNDQEEVREGELRKLNGMQEDLVNIRKLLDNLNVSTLPDGGVELTERLTALESSVLVCTSLLQGDKVANMVVEPNVPTPEDIAGDDFNKDMSWDDSQEASNVVQPRMFEKQAMASHMAERNLILSRLGDMHASLGSRPTENAHAAPPATLRTALMPHQLHALAWLRWRETQCPCGGILADDMGLGKTITMISLILSDNEDKIDDDYDVDDDDGDEDDVDRRRSSSKLVRGGTLVVCPASLMQQWADEVDKHYRPHSLRLCLHHGAARAQHPHLLAAKHLVLTSYNILQRDTAKGGVLTRMRWRRVVLDEAHIVRNHKSATSTSVCGVRARRRWALTGTPLHNKHLDLFALMKFLVVTPFDNLQMWKKWIDNKSISGQERLSAIMRCIMLRRTKVQLQQRGELACLPARTVHQRLVTLTKDEMNVYQKVLVLSKTLFAQYLYQLPEKIADAQEDIPPEKDTDYANMHKKMIALKGAQPVECHKIPVLLLRLRQVCCHCGLIAAILDHEQGAAMLDHEQGAAMLDHEQGAAMLDHEQGAAMLDHEQGAAMLDHEQGAAMLDHQQGAAMLDHEQGAAMLDHEQGAAMLEHEQGAAMLDHDKGAAMLDHEQGAAMLDHEQGAAMLDHEQGAAMLDHEQGAAMLDHEQGAAMLDHEQGAAMLDHEQGAAMLNHEQGAAMLDHEQGAAMLDHEQGAAMLDHEQGAAMLDHEQGAADDLAGQDLLAELNKETTNETKKDEAEEEEPHESTSVTEAIRSVLSANNPVFELSRPSSKISAVMDCLQSDVLSKPGDKAVVVSQWPSVLRLVEKELTRMTVRSVTLSGTVPVRARAPLIDALNNPSSDVKVMLLSLCVGGVGLNLCGANHMLLLDPHWNPQLEEQAQDRIYRVGQKKDVYIYRFMCVNTVEQTIRKLQAAKLKLADNVLTGARLTNGSKLSIEDLKLLFNMAE